MDGLVHLTNTGTIRSINAFSQPADGPAFSEGMSVGGGTIINSGTIQGSVAPGNTNAVGRGITLTGNDRPGGGRDPIYAMRPSPIRLAALSRAIAIRALRWSAPMRQVTR